MTVADSCGRATGNLDSRTSVEVMGIFQRLNAEQGITVLLITHEHELASTAQGSSPFATPRAEQYAVTNRRNAGHRARSSRSLSSW